MSASVFDDKSVKPDSKTLVKSDWKDHRALEKDKEQPGK